MSGAKSGALKVATALNSSLGASVRSAVLSAGRWARTSLALKAQHSVRQAVASARFSSGKRHCGIQSSVGTKPKSSRLPLRYSSVKTAVSGAMMGPSSWAQKAAKCGLAVSKRACAKRRGCGSKAKSSRLSWLVPSSSIKSSGLMAWLKAVLRACAG